MGYVILTYPQYEPENGSFWGKLDLPAPSEPPCARRNYDALPHPASDLRRPQADFLEEIFRASDRPGNLLPTGGGRCRILYARA